MIEQNWLVQRKDSRIYEILHSLGLLHQRGHRDYANADVTSGNVLDLLFSPKMAAQTHND